MPDSAHVLAIALTERAPVLAVHFWLIDSWALVFGWVLRFLRLVDSAALQDCRLGVSERAPLRSLARFQSPQRLPRMLASRPNRSTNPSRILSYVAALAQPDRSEHAAR